MSNTNPTPQSSSTTAAFYVQAMLSFGVAIVAVVAGVLYLPADPWVKAFLGITVLYVTTSAFTLAKCIRDKQEVQAVAQYRLEQARLHAEHGGQFRTAG